MTNDGKSDGAKRILVSGATGMQGRPIVEALLAQGHTVRALTRQAEPGLPDGVRITRGDFDDLGALGAAFENVDRAVLMLPLVFDADAVTRYTRNFAAAARDCELVVFDTSAPVPDGALIAPAGTEIAALYRRLSHEGAARLNVTRHGWTNGTTELGVRPTQIERWAAHVPCEAIAAA